MGSGLVAGNWITFLDKGSEHLDSVFLDLLILNGTNG